MKTVQEILQKSPIWVNPEHTAETAAILLKGHDIGALAVLDNNQLVGLVCYQHVLGVKPETLVRDIMVENVPVLSPEMSVKQAADIMSRNRLGRLPVEREGRLVGMVTDGDLLPEVGRSIDPLTHLPWSDSLREWAIEELKRGNELTVLFIDLNRFGYFNKKFGHLVGDDVLRSVARALEPLIDPETDYLCKYGGDEFCIGTLRPSNEATELGNRAARKIAEITVPGAGGEGITCSVGQFGGKRTREREHTHFAATLNSLINLASRECIANKTMAEIESVMDGDIDQSSQRPRIRLAWIEVKWTGPRAQVRVDLEQYGCPVPSNGDGTEPNGSRRFPTTRSARTDEIGVLQLVAEATTSSLQRLLPEGYTFRFSEVITNQTSDGQMLITAVGEFGSGDNIVPVAGSAVVGGDPYRAAAAAVLAAVNRLLGRLPCGEAVVYSPAS